MTNCTQNLGIDCQHCGDFQSTVTPKTFANGTEHLEAKCAGCGRHQKWVRDKDIATDKEQSFDRVVVELTTLPNQDVPAVVRMRRLLKMSLRACGFKAKILDNGPSEER